MLVGLDWCQTCTLGSRIWKKMKIKKGGPNWTPSTHFILSFPLGMRASACAWTSKVSKRAWASSDGGWSSALSIASPLNLFFFFLPSFLFLSFFFFLTSSFFPSFSSSSFFATAIAIRKHHNEKNTPRRLEEGAPPPSSFSLTLV